MWTCQDVVNYVFEIAPDPKPPESTENGFLFGEGDAEVHRIALMWRPTPELLRAAGEFGAELVVGHEPIFYPGTKQYFWGIPQQEDEKPINREHRGLLTRYSMAYARFHSNVDIVDWGMPGALLDVLGFGGCARDWHKYMPLVRILPTRVYALADMCQARLDLSHVRVVGDLNAEVCKLSVCWGGLSRTSAGIDCALRMGADVILGGDLTDAAALTAAAANVPIIECGHAHTEMPAMRVLTDKLAKHFRSLQVRFFANDEPWVVRAAKATSDSTGPHRLA